MIEPKLFRMPVTIAGAMNPIDVKPDTISPLFGLSENVTFVLIDHVHSGKDRASARGGCKLDLNFASMSDGENVLSASLTLHDAEGAVLEMISVMIAQQDAERIGSAISALFHLTPKPGENA